MGRLALISVVTGIALAVIIAWTWRESVAYAQEPTPSTAELVQASVRGCMEGLGHAEVGISDGVALVRCRANLGVGR